MKADLNLELVFKGADSSLGVINFYDIAKALVGFERTISLTNHLLLNGEVITQSPSASGFELLLSPPEIGSWKAIAGIVFGTALTVGVASKDSALGYLSASALDYVIQQALGFHVDFDSTLGEQLEEAKKDKIIENNLSEDRFDSLIEKVEPSLKDCHRPIVFSETATNAQINWSTARGQGKLDGFFDAETYDYISATVRDKNLDEFTGAISSYNVNTFKGRIYIDSMNRTIPFELGDLARNARSAAMIVASMYENTSRMNTFAKYVTLRGFRNESKNDRLKSLFVVEVSASGKIK